MGEVLGRLTIIAILVLIQGISKSLQIFSQSIVSGYPALLPSGMTCVMYLCALQKSAFCSQSIESLPPCRICMASSAACRSSAGVRLRGNGSLQIYYQIILDGGSGDIQDIDCLDRRTPSDNPFPPLSIPLPQIHRRSPLSTRTLPSFQLQQDAGILCQPRHRYKDIQININRLLVIPHKLQRRNLFRFEILISLDLLLTENRI